MTAPTPESVRPSIAYRGSGRTDSFGTSQPGRILLLVQPGGNRDILVECLSRRHHIVEPSGDDKLPETFDLCVVDTASFVKWRLQLTDAKAREQPVFLPVLLILQKRHLAARIEQTWDAVDEFVVAPIDKREFINRIGLLLRARRLALTQQEDLAYVVNYDRTTGLPNKRQFLERLSAAVQDGSILNTSFHVAVVRVHFDTILKSLGSTGSTQAAVQLSRRLKACTGRISCVGRLDSEDWALLLQPGSEDMPAVVETLNEIAASFRKPLEIEGERIYPRAAIGVARYPDDGRQAAGLLDAASAARANATNGEPAFYSGTVQYHALRYLRTEARLRDAIRDGGFQLYFQPRVNLETGDVVSAEALIRWKMPTGEMVSPGEFIPVAEATGLISDIDRWVIVQACNCLARWRRDGRGAPSLSVNVTPADIEREDFRDTLLTSLDAGDLACDALELELTETTLFQMSFKNLGKLRELRNLGFPLAMDDFGTGYSSLSYLHNLPLSVLKIDRAFVSGLPDDPGSCAIIQTIVQLGRNFGLSIVAEGIETEAQARYLHEIGCSLGQGFFFAKPLPEAEFTELVASRPWSSVAARREATG